MIIFKQEMNVHNALIYRVKCTQGHVHKRIISGQFGNGYRQSEDEVSTWEYLDWLRTRTTGYE